LDSCFSDSFSKKDEKSLLPPDFKTSENHVGRSILPALVDTMERFEIPAKYVFAIIDGAIQDLEKNRYAAFDELEKYCELVASAVGLACIHVWGFAGRGTPEQEKVFELARRVGIAYQLTNILRDVKEDAAMDRVYLPQDDLNAAGYSVEELKRGVVNPCLLKLMQIEIGLAEEYYQSSRELYCHINPDGRKLFGLMTGTYHTLLTKIARNPAAVLSKRIRLVFFERLRLARRWMGKLPQELEW
jgi:phytoene synthase